MGSIKIYTDGGCSGNPGAGGWAFIIAKETSQGEKILFQDSGGEKSTTNNRMELTAVISALKALISKGGFSGRITVYTDSQYVQKGITEWISGWKLKSWRTADKKPVKNQDLWMELDTLTGEFSIEWKWIRGHSGIEFNELCDRMTQEAILLIKNGQCKDSYL